MKKTLVIGASTNPQRYSYKAMMMLKENHYDVVALGLKTGIVAGVSIDKEWKQYTDLDTVTLYLNPKRQEEYYDYIINLKPKRIIFNPGTENPNFYELLKENNILYEEACTLVLLSTKQY